MKPNELAICALAKISEERRQRQDSAQEQLGELLDQVDLFVWHTQNWLCRQNASAYTATEILGCPKRSRTHSILRLSNVAVQGLAALAEIYRIGTFYPGGWIERALFEAKTNAVFIAYEPTRLAGQRWINYGFHRLAKLQGDDEEVRALIQEIEARFPDDNLRKENWWAKTIDHKGKPQIFSSLPDRAKYVEKLWTNSQEIPPFMQRMRQGGHEYELMMIRKDNMVVHPTMAGDQIGPNPVRALYSGIQLTWNTLAAYSRNEGGQKPTPEMEQAHGQFVESVIDVLDSIIKNDPTPT